MKKDGAGIRLLRFFYGRGFSQILRRVAMVSRVSPNCVRAVPSSVISSTVSLQARALASAVMEAVNSQAFTMYHP